MPSRMLKWRNVAVGVCVCGGVWLCVIEDEFVPNLSDEHIAWAWSTIDYAPKPLHQGLRNSFSSKTIRTKLQTVFDLVDLI